MLKSLHRIIFCFIFASCLTIKKIEIMVTLTKKYGVIEIKKIVDHSDNSEINIHTIHFQSNNKKTCENWQKKQGTIGSMYEVLTAKQLELSEESLNH